MGKSAYLLAGTTLALALSIAPLSCAHAQYFHEGPQKPEVEVDLSVLDDYGAPAPHGYRAPQPPGFPAPITAPVARQPATVEQAPLPPLRSPYDSKRVVERIELEGANPYLGSAMPSPFAPTTVLKPPPVRPQAETPRTVPVARPVPKPPSIVDSAAPLVIEAEPEALHDDITEGTEMPAINVTQDIRHAETARTAPVKPPRKAAPVAMPVRKPAVLSLASDRQATPVIAAKQAPVFTMPPEAVLPPAAPPPPAVVAMPPEIKKSAERVIEDLYALPPAKAETSPPVDLAAADLSPFLSQGEIIQPPAEIAPPAAVQAAATPAVTHSLAFAPDSTTLDASTHTTLDDIATRMGAASQSRLLVKGYAAGTDRASARRISVGRALAVRAYLMDKGIKPSRIDVRGMGNEAAEGTPERVDLVLLP